MAGTDDREPAHRRDIGQRRGTAPNRLRPGSAPLGRPMPPPRSAELRPPPPRTSVLAFALLLSLLLHSLLLLPLHRKIIAAPEEIVLLPVTILPPPPPPPPPPVAVGVEESGAVVEPEPDKLALNAVPEPTPPAQKPTPRDTPKPRAKATPKAETKVVEAPAAGGAEGGQPGGVAGGISGGEVGGQLGGEVGGTIGGVVGGTGDGPIPIDRVASPPTLVNQVQPVYPPVARARSLEGVVMIELIVDREGRVEEDSIAVTKSAPAFDAAAIAAVRKWRFRPGRQNDGRAVRVILEVPIRFRLR